MSPVASHPSFAIIGPRTRISPSSAICSSTPGSGSAGLPVAMAEAVSVMP